MKFAHHNGWVATGYRLSKEGSADVIAGKIKLFEAITVTTVDGKTRNLGVSSSHVTIMHITCVFEPVEI